MKLEDLKTENPQAAVEQMCGLDNAELDRVAAELQGWEVILGAKDPYAPPSYEAIWWVDIPGEDHFKLSEWSPSTDLNQAYGLLGEKKLARQWSHIRQAYSLWLEQRSYEPVINLYDESKAGSHARAVTILACVGLLFGGGK